MDLAKALRLPENLPLAFVGAGGKSTALFLLARRLSGDQHLPVLVTSTTHLHVDQTQLADSHQIAVTPADLNDLESHLHGVMLITGPVDRDRTTGVDSATISWLSEFCENHGLLLLIEADGSRQHPLKAPAEHEPPIPPFVKIVVVVAGLTGIGKPLAEPFVHRQQIFSQLSGLPLSAPVTPEALAQVLTHPAGGLKNIPALARRVALLNQADTPDLQALGNTLAQRLLPPFDSAITASLSTQTIYSVHEPVAGIVLAAGEAIRFGQPKQLLDYHGQPFVRQVVQTAISAGLSPAVVVTGANAEKVESALAGLPVQIVRNGAWKTGQSSSIRLGLESLPPNAGACLFLLADQPQVTPAVIAALVERHRQDLPPVVAPRVAGQRANPVLFDRTTFPALMALRGDIGGRAIFSQFPPAYMDWMDESLLIDIDTPADWKRFQESH